MLPLQPYLYTAPSDVVDMLGTEGVDLRLDDHSLASGQTVKVMADAVLGATTLTVAALSAPLLRGTLLSFDGAGMPAVVQAILSATATTGSTALSVLALTGPINNQAAAIDSGVNIATGARLVKACNYGTADVKLFCLGRYEDSMLASSWIVNRWATTVAARWLCMRRAQGVPKGVEADWKESQEKMKQVRYNALNIEDIGVRDVTWPFISNISINLNATYTKLRVEPQISEGSVTQYGQFIDWSAALSLEW